MSILVSGAQKVARCTGFQPLQQKVSRVFSSGANLRNTEGINDVPRANRQVFSFGCGSHGALGTSAPPFLDAYEPEAVRNIPSDIVSIVAGHYHSLALTSSGSLWAWGRGSEGQLGPRKPTSGTVVRDWYPAEVEGLEGIKVVGAAASAVVSMALGSDGSLWAMGSSKRGQLGLGQGVVKALKPAKLSGLDTRQVTQVALGWGHALACTSENEVFAWGYAQGGRLGLGVSPASDQERLSATSAGIHAESWGNRVDEAESFVVQSMEGEREVHLEWGPQQVHALGGCGVVQVACGMDHSVARCDDGSVYCFGDNSLNQLGPPPPDTSCGAPFKLQGLKATQVACGLGHSLAIGKHHASVVSSWGDNVGGQLGTGVGKAGGLDTVTGWGGGPILKVSGGRVHSCALTEEGEVWSWGSGRNGRLGQGSSRDSLLPGLVEGLEDWKVIDIACGFDHTLILVEERVV